MPSISVPTAIIGAAAVGTVGTALSANAAAHAQEKAAQTASSTELNMYNQNKGELQPFITGGQEAYGTLNQLLGIGGNSSTIQDTLNNLPGYQFTLNQGLKSTQSGYAARGLGSSGGALKGAANYATGLANANYTNYLSGLQNSANTGESAAGALAGAGTATGNEIASNQIGAGNAAAGALTATGNALAGGANSLAQYYTLRNFLNSANSGGSPTSGAGDDASFWNGPGS